jgi:hypothetical protein
MGVLRAILQFLQDYDGAVTAAATIVVAFFTYCLVVVTNRQARLTRAAIELGNREYVSTHRPKLRVRKIRLGTTVPDRPIAISYVVANVGVGEARIMHHELALEVRRDGQILHRTEASSAFEKPITGGAVVLDGLAGDFPYEEAWRLRDSETVLLTFRGLIEYQDENGVSRFTEFRRDYDWRTDRFTRSDDDPDYEYED